MAPAYIGQQVEVLVYYVCQKNSYTKKNENMFFGTWIDVEGDWIDTVHFPSSAKAYPIQGKGFYRIRGKVTVEFGAVMIVADSMWKVGIRNE